MYPKPIDELKMLESLPGFEELTDDEKMKFRILSFEYNDHPALTTATLLFAYNNTHMKYELSCCRQEGCIFQHVLYGEDYNQNEFPSFREAIDYINCIPKKNS